MKWIAHHIRLPDSSSTMGHQEGHSERVLRHIQLVADVLAKPLTQVRTLDLAVWRVVSPSNLPCKELRPSVWRAGKRILISVKPSGLGKL